MRHSQKEIGNWVLCDSLSALLDQLPWAKKNKLLTTDDPNTWGYFTFSAEIIIPVGYADLGLPPSAVKAKNKIFIGTNELVAGYDSFGKDLLFKYQMPTVFHEFVQFNQDDLIVRDEIGFVGLSYDGEERWSFCIDAIGSYDINGAQISGKTEDGEIFRFDIPSA